MDFVRPELTAFEEAELKVQTMNMYKYGGASNVFSAIIMMTKCQTVILNKLLEILESEYGLRKP